MDELTEITQHLLHFSPDALVVIDAEGRIRFANETVHAMFGHRPEALIGETLDVLIPERLRGRHGTHVATYLRQPDNREMGARIADLFALRKDGSEFSAGIRLAPFRIGDRVFVAAAIRDTTERRLVNEELITARVEADRANRAKSRFLATASHDLRQPLQTVRLLNAALRKMVPETAARELLEQQGQAIEGMTRLLDALLDISRLESGAIEPSRQQVRLSDVFRDLRSEFSSVATSRDIALEIDTTNAVLMTDPTLLAQLLQNLLGNAIKYTDHGKVRVSAALEEDALTIGVQDTGIGIPSDKLERIFDEYYQVDTHGAKRMGVGLGLAIVKEVARLLGFTVRISSKPCEGTLVRVRVPLHFVTTAVDVAAEIGVSSAPHTQSDKARLLLVEDNDGVRMATEVFLKLEGHETLSAATVADAEKLFDQFRAGDVLIADFHLDPSTTGLDLLLKLRERKGYDVPAVLLSGDLPSMRRSIGQDITRCRFLGKPVDTTALIDAIRELSD